MNTSGTRAAILGLILVVLGMTVFRAALMTPANRDATTITVSFWGSYEEWAMWQDIVAGFHEKNPDIRVKLEYIPGSYDDKVQLLLAADTPPDIMLIQDEPFPGYAAYGKFADLTEWAYSDDCPVDWDNGFWPTAAESFRHNGRVMGAPIWGGNVLVYYNRKMFRELGIEPPSDDWTFDEFIAKGKELTRDLDNDGRLDTFGFTLPHWVYFLPWTWGCGADYLDETFTDWAFTGPEAVAAVTLYQDLRFNYHMSPSVQEVPGQQEGAMFMTGKIGMFVSGPWASPSLKTSGVDFDVVHIPTGTAGQRYTRVTWDAICLSALCEHKDEALRFMGHCLSLEAQSIVGEYVRSVPAVIAAKDAFMDPDNGWSEEKYIDALSYARMQPISLHWNEMRQILDAIYEQVLLNRITPEDAVEQMANAMHDDGVFPIEQEPSVVGEKDAT